MAIKGRPLYIREFAFQIANINQVEPNSNFDLVLILEKKIEFIETNPPLLLSPVRVQNRKCEVEENISFLKPLIFRT